jgi:hypothetical protein
MAKKTVRSNGPAWTLTFREFTKQSAREALGKMRMQRTLDVAWAAALGRTMDLGLWESYRPSQKPIAIDVDGFLINGQHRLTAFVNHSKLDTITFPVATGCDPSDYAGFDQDEKLRMQNAAHPGRANVSRDKARVRWAEALVQASVDVKLTQPMFTHLADKTWRRQLEWADETIGLARWQGRQAYVAPLMYVHRLDPAFADKIGKSWANGGDALPAPLFRLRDEALREAGNGTRQQALSTSFKVLNALAAMHEGKPMPVRLSNNISGLRYFSGKLRDGVSARWDKALLLTDAE